MRPKVTVPWVSVDFVVQRQTLQSLAKWRLLWSNPLRSPLRAPTKRPNALLQVAWNCCKVYIIELIDLYLLDVRHPINQGKCNDRREHVENHLASSKWLRLVIAQKNWHNLGHQDLIVPTFPLYAHAKSACTLRRFADGVQNIQPMDETIFSTWLQPWQSRLPRWT